MKIPFRFHIYHLFRGFQSLFTLTNLYKEGMNYGSKRHNTPENGETDHNNPETGEEMD